MKVYLIRHAQSEGNVLDLRSVTTVAEFNDLLRRSHAHPLTPLGERQARGLVSRLAEARIERLYSSPFIRALSTATFLGEALGLTPVVIDELREVVPNALDERYRARSLRRFYLWSFAAMAWRRETGATWRDEYRRAKAAWARITAEPAEEIAAVSHGWLISLMLLSLRRDSRCRIVSRDVRNAGISVVVVRE